MLGDHWTRIPRGIKEQIPYPPSASWTTNNVPKEEPDVEIENAGQSVRCWKLENVKGCLCGLVGLPWRKWTDASHHLARCLHLASRIIVPEVQNKSVIRYKFAFYERTSQKPSSGGTCCVQWHKEGYSPEYLCSADLYPFGWAAVHFLCVNNSLLHAVFAVLSPTPKFGPKIARALATWHDKVVFLGKTPPLARGSFGKWSVNEFISNWPVVVNYIEAFWKPNCPARAASLQIAACCPSFMLW